MKPPIMRELDAEFNEYLKSTNISTVLIQYITSARLYLKKNNYAFDQEELTGVCFRLLKGNIYETGKFPFKYFKGMLDRWMHTYMTRRSGLRDVFKDLEAPDISEIAKAIKIVFPSPEEQNRLLKRTRDFQKDSIEKFIAANLPKHPVEKGYDEQSEEQERESEGREQENEKREREIEDAPISQRKQKRTRVAPKILDSEDTDISVNNSSLFTKETIEPVPTTRVLRRRKAPSDTVINEVIEKPKAKKGTPALPNETQTNKAARNTKTALQGRTPISNRPTISNRTALMNDDMRSNGIISAPKTKEQQKSKISTASRPSIAKRSESRGNAPESLRKEIAAVEIKKPFDSEETDTESDFEKLQNENEGDQNQDILRDLIRSSSLKDLGQFDLEKAVEIISASERDNEAGFISPFEKREIPDRRIPNDLADATKFFDSKQLAVSESQDLVTINKESLGTDGDEAKLRLYIQDNMTDNILEFQLQIDDIHYKVLEDVLLSGASLTAFSKAASIVDNSFNFEPTMETVLRNSLRIATKEGTTHYTPIYNLIRALVGNDYLMRYIKSKRYKREAYFNVDVFQNAFAQEKDDTLYFYFDLFTKKIASSGGSQNSCVVYQILNIPLEARKSRKFKICSGVTEELNNLLKLSFLEVDVINQNWDIDGLKIQVVPIVSSSDYLSAVDLLSLKDPNNRKPCGICETELIFNDDDLGKTKRNENDWTHKARDMSNEEVYARSGIMWKPYFSNKWQMVYQLNHFKLSQFRTVLEMIHSVLDDEDIELLNAISKSITPPNDKPKLAVDLFPPDNLTSSDFDIAMCILPIIVYQLERVVEADFETLLILFFEYQLIIKKQFYTQQEFTFLHAFPYMFFDLMRRCFRPTEEESQKFYTLQLHQLYHTWNLVRAVGPLACYESEGLQRELEFIEDLVKSCRYLPKAYDYKLAAMNNLKYFNISLWIPEESVILKDEAENGNFNKVYLQKLDETITDCYVAIGNDLIKVETYYTSVQGPKTSQNFMGKVVDPGRCKIFYGISKQILCVTVSSDNSDDEILESFEAVRIEKLFYVCDHFSNQGKILLIRQC
ncbi:hypothetical protein DASC09_014530 [Saccharomycopsis crataegensis]|uniref:Uncharacterized protein n=1 Tax=Saccharomycopsis crataegensis TaxID=43959 RepID=A0AAV5QH00_9ASCO|nr:hypothetical protein DASC09_014530 [Saccharomycopsis crataegensis]